MSFVSGEHRKEVVRETKAERSGAYDIILRTSLYRPAVFIHIDRNHFDVIKNLLNFEENTC